MPHPIYAFLKDLLRQPSITPNDADCMALISAQLAETNATIRELAIKDTKNLLVSHGNGTPHIVFVGHTDVVPPGDINAWQSDPFTPTERDGFLYARGAADMKSGVAAMTLAFKAAITQHPNHSGTLSLLLTSDEEGSGDNGIKAVMAKLSAEKGHFDYAIVGEPTCKNALGDTARNGRRGSLNLNLTIHGQQGHVAYPEQIKNPIHGLGQIIAEISAIEWDKGNANFPPTSCQFSNISGGTGAENVAPATASAMLNWRFNTEQTEAGIKARVTGIIEAICRKQHLSASYQWRLSGEPFATNNQDLMHALAAAVKSATGKDLLFNTAGGTSDARFMAKYGAATVEFGPCNATIHKIDECVKMSDLEPLVAIYTQTLENLWRALN